MIKKQKDTIICAAIFVAVLFLTLLSLIFVKNHLDEKRMEAEAATVQESEDAQENEKIDAALIEQGYIRESSPLPIEEQKMLRAACDEFDVPFELALAVIWKETGYRNVTGDNGDAEGYMQIQKRWAYPEMEQLGVTDLMNPAVNFRVGCLLLREFYDDLGTWQDAVQRYNPNATGYAETIIAYWEGLKS